MKMIETLKRKLKIHLNKWRKKQTQKLEEINKSLLKKENHDKQLNQ